MAPGQADGLAETTGVKSDVVGARLRWRAPT
ncbi:MAG: hypothetical protein JWN81_2154 [Solirubrobacterales bacterium]|nr:hypothetical protein [Solirubrobacterales bacterium]